MVMEAFVHIHEERYYSALNTVDQINQRLDAMDSARFASQLRRWMPSLTEMINKATKEEVRLPAINTGTTPVECSLQLKRKRLWHPHRLISTSAPPHSVEFGHVGFPARPMYPNQLISFAPHRTAPTAHMHT